MGKDFVLNGNKLIAEFMNIKLSNEWDDGLDYASKNVWNFNDEYYNCESSDELGFHESWDWLMPCCKKAIKIYGIKKCKKLIESFKTCDIYIVYNNLIQILS